MPPKKSRRVAPAPAAVAKTEPLTACLDGDAEYICTAHHPCSFVIQKVTSSPRGLNPNAEIFESKLCDVESDDCCSWDGADRDGIALNDSSYFRGYVYMNGDISKLPSGAVYPTTPDPLASTAPTSEYSGPLNGVADSADTYVQAGTPPGGLLADPSPGSDAAIPLDQLKQMLSSQLEYYFSRENLANDAYLLSQMDNDQYVPIWTVANFNQVKRLTKDIKLITEVLRESPNVQVDEEGIKVRPNHKRCIVILREIPDNTPLEEVKALFSGEGCPRLISCEFAHNNSWYVTFESDEDAQKAYRFLREEVREFQGKPIMARIKAKPMNRLPLPPVSAMGAAAMKNGYRTPPTAIYDPNSYPSQQRFMYSNGSSLPPNVNYGNQVQIYTFQQQPFYAPGMLQPWPPAPGFMELGSVFSFNGLAPQASFAKPQGSRAYNTRNRNKRNQPLSDRSSLSDAMNLNRHSAGSHSYHHPLGGMGNTVTVGGTHTKNASSASGFIPSVGGKLQAMAAVGVVNDVHHNHSKNHQTSLQDTNESSSVPSQSLPGPLLRGDNEDYRQSRDLSAKEPMPPRHRRRRKEDDLGVSGRTSVVGPNKPASSSSPQPAQSLNPSSRGAQFDLEATAFPPLPGMDNGVGINTKTSVPIENISVDPSNSQWENRLSDVVKGTAKSKCQNVSTNNKDKDNSYGTAAASSRSTTPTSPVLKTIVAQVAADSKPNQSQHVQQQPVQLSQPQSRQQQPQTAQQQQLQPQSHLQHMHHQPQMQPPQHAHQQPQLHQTLPLPHQQMHQQHHHNSPHQPSHQPLQQHQSQQQHLPSALQHQQQPLVSQQRSQLQQPQMQGAPQSAVASQQSGQNLGNMAHVMQSHATKVNQAQLPVLPKPVSSQPVPIQPHHRQTSHPAYPALVTTVSVTVSEIKEGGAGNDAGFSSFALTPPLSPEKTVPVATKVMADKSTKTDDSLLSSDSTGGSKNMNSKTGDGYNVKHSLPAPQNVTSSKPVPTTTNAATMTSAVVVSDVTAPSRTTSTPTSSHSVTTSSVHSHSATNCTPGENLNSMPAGCVNNVCPSHASALLGTTTLSTTPTTTTSAGECLGTNVRPSYAQVAQHHKEKVERILREKQSTEQQEKDKKDDKDRKKDAAATRCAQHGDNRESTPRDYKDNSAVRYAGMGRGRPGQYERQDRSIGVRRRDVPEKVSRFREMIPPRSPK